MNKEVLTKVAELSTYLDEHGYKEESHALDHKLMSLAQGKTLTISGKPYTSYQQVWSAWGNEASFDDIRMALNSDARNSEDLQADLKAYFGVATPERPGQVVDEEGAAKPAQEELQWYDPRDWAEYARRYMREHRTETPGFGGVTHRRQ